MFQKYLFFLLLILSACNNPKNDKPEKEVQLSEVASQGINVITTNIPKSGFSRQLAANGKIEAVEKTDLRFKAGNRLAYIGVKNGTSVKKGQLIAHLENALLKNRLEKARIELEKAKVKLEEAIINYNYGNTDENTISKEILHNLKLKSGVLDAENNFENARLEYEQTLLKAPFSGVIANIKTREGDYISASDVFCTLINRQKLAVHFSVLENEYPFIKPGQTVSVSGLDQTDEVFQGRITEINPAVDKNGLIWVKALITSKKPPFLDGMHVNVLVNFPLNNVLTLPKQAIVLRSNRKVVFSLKNGLAYWNYVTVLSENSKYVAVKKGENLKETDTVIISGNINLSHEAKVNAKFIPQIKS